MSHSHRAMLGLADGHQSGKHRSIEVARVRKNLLVFTTNIYYGTAAIGGSV